MSFFIASSLWLEAFSLRCSATDDLDFSELKAPGIMLDSHMGIA
jgi:hypothetical protein